MSQPPFTPQFSAPPEPPPTSGKATTAMVLGLLSFVLTCLAGIPAIVAGLLALREIGQSRGKLRGKGLATTGIVLGAVGTLLGGCGIVAVLPAVMAAREAARQTQSHNNLKQIGLAIHNYHDVFNRFPMAGTEDPEAGLGLSWRVRILAFMEHRPLSDQVNWNEPWDSEAHSQLRPRIPDHYRAPPASPDSYQTVYQGFTSDEPVQWNAGRGSPIFGNGRQTAGFADCIDGTSNTILIAEADRDREVPWMKPADLRFDPQQPKDGLGHLRPGGFLVLMADGSTRFVSNSIDDETLRRLVIMNDGLVIGSANAPGPRFSPAP